MIPRNTVARGPSCGGGHCGEPRNARKGCMVRAQGIWTREWTTRELPKIGRCRGCVYISIHIWRQKSIQELNTCADFFESNAGRTVLGPAAGDARCFALDGVLRRLCVCCRTVWARGVVGSGVVGCGYTYAGDRKLGWPGRGCVALFGVYRRGASRWKSLKPCSAPAYQPDLNILGTPVPTDLTSPRRHADSWECRRA